MIIKSAKSKWAKSCQVKLLDMANETDSCAAIEGARMSVNDREMMKRLCNKVAKLLSKY